MLRSITLAALASSAIAEVYFSETFSSDSYTDTWKESTWKGAEMGKFKHTSGAFSVNEEEAKGIQTSMDMGFHAISAKFAKAFSNRDKNLVVGFTAKHEEHKYGFCGGGYIKLLPGEFDQAKFGGDTPYSVMFGPDLCSYDVSRIHVIFTDDDGKNLLKKDEIKLEHDDKNEFTHSYVLVVKPDNTFEVFMDFKSKSTGSLLDGWDFAPKQIDDPKDTKPEDWVDDKKINDPAVKKPEGYDDIAEKIPDPKAEKPEDWDDEDDGEWEAPTIANPDFKGPWTHPQIDNPAYKGEFKPKQIDNPKYKDDVYAFDNLSGVGFEVWTVNKGSIFDNIIVSDSVDEANKFLETHFRATLDGEKAVKEKADADKKAAEEAANKAKEAAEKAKKAEETEAEETEAEDATDAKDAGDAKDEGEKKPEL